jgi:hypothetical protein
MKLFDYLKVVFGRDEDWDSLTGYDKSKNSFMLNRMMSARFPMQSSLFNSLRTDPVGAAESWRMVGSKFSRVPAFIYTKVSKKKEALKQYSPDPRALAEYLKINQIGMREYHEALQHNPAAVKTAIDTLQKQLGNEHE